jgi:hypothetical protein
MKAWDRARAFGNPCTFPRQHFQLGPPPKPGEQERTPAHRYPPWWAGQGRLIWKGADVRLGGCMPGVYQMFVLRRREVSGLGSAVLRPSHPILTVKCWGGWTWLLQHVKSGGTDLGAPRGGFQRLFLHSKCPCGRLSPHCCPSIQPWRV